MSITFTEYPPGTTFFTPGEYDDLGNFVPTAPPQPVSLNPVTNEPIAPVAPVYAAPPVPVTTNKVNRLSVFVREGVRCADIDQLYSTGRLKPKVAEGWTASQNAVDRNGQNATTIIPATGFTLELDAKQFPITLPVEAEISGIVVYVQRSAI